MQFLFDTSQEPRSGCLLTGMMPRYRQFSAALFAFAMLVGRTEAQSEPEPGKPVACIGWCITWAPSIGVTSQSASRTPARTSMAPLQAAINADHLTKGSGAPTHVSVRLEATLDCARPRTSHVLHQKHARVSLGQIRTPGRPLKQGPPRAALGHIARNKLSAANIRGVPGVTMYARSSLAGRAEPPSLLQYPELLWALQTANRSDRIRNEQEPAPTVAAVAAEVAPTSRDVRPSSTATVRAVRAAVERTDPAENAPVTSLRKTETPAETSAANTLSNRPADGTEPDSPRTFELLWADDHVPEGLSVLRGDKGRTVNGPLTQDFRSSFGVGAGMLFGISLLLYWLVAPSRR